MQKKCAFWVTVAFVAFLGHGCSQPISVNLKIKTDNFNYSFGTALGTVDLASIFNAVFDQDSIPELRLYDMVNYPGTQAFLAAYEMELMESFNPNDYLQEINLDLAKQPIKSEIALPQITPDENEIEDQVYWFSLKDLLGDIDDKIDTSMPAIPDSTIPIFPGGGESNWPSGEELPSIITWSGDASVNFNSLVVGTGTATLTISGTGLNDQTSITLRDIGLRAGDRSVGSVNGTGSITLDGGTTTGTVTINLEDAEILKDNVPRFVIGKISCSNSGPLPATVNLTITPQLDDFKLRGVKGLKIIDSKMTKLTENLIVPFNDLPSGFINAKISGETTFSMDIKMPPKTENPRSTYMTGAKLSYTIAMNQALFPFGGNNFEGLDVTLKNNGAESAPKWINKNDLKVNASNTFIMIEQENANGIDFELFDGDKYSNANNTYNAFEDIALPVLVKMGIKIKDMELLRWKTEDEGASVIPLPQVTVNFGAIGGKDISKFISKIEFNSITAQIDFEQDGLPKALEKKLALKPNCAELGFDPGDNTNNPYKEMDFSTTFNGIPGTLDLKDVSGNPKELTILLDYAPVVPADPNLDGSPLAPNKNAGYMQLGPLTINDTGITTLKISGEASFDFDWKTAEINLNELITSQSGANNFLTGSFPGKDSEPLDFSEANQYMKGFRLGDVDAEIILGGPQRLINDIKPEIKLSVKYEELKDNDWKPNDELLLDSTPLQANNAGNLFSLLPSKDINGKYVYDKKDLPSPEGSQSLKSFIDVIEKFPRDLRFNYEMKFSQTGAGTITVEKDWFDNDNYGEGNHAIKALLVLKFPLELVAEPGAQVKIPNGDFVAKDDNGNELLDGNGKVKLKDLFGRESADGLTPDVKPDSSDDPFKDVVLREIKVSIEFDRNFLQGAVLHVDRNQLLFGAGGLPLTQGNKLEILLKEKDYDIFRKNIIQPEITIEFPKRSVLSIPRNCVPTRVSFSARGDFTQKIEF